MTKIRLERIGRGKKLRLNTSAKPSATLAALRKPVSHSSRPVAWVGTLTSPEIKTLQPLTSWPALPEARFSLKEIIPPAAMEVAVAIGTDPAVTFSAIVPAPPDVEEYLIAGFLRAAPVELVKCETVDLQVPASSEIVLEGYVNLDELRTEGPFGDHTGFYSLEDLYPVFHVQCITHRKDPIYSTTIVGKPPMEDAFMGKAVERVFLSLMRLTIPELIDINLPIEGVFHNLNDRLHPQVLSRPSPQSDECHLVARPGHVHGKSSSWSTKT